MFPIIKFLGGSIYICTETVKLRGNEGGGRGGGGGEVEEGLCFS